MARIIGVFIPPSGANRLNMDRLPKQHRVEAPSSALSPHVDDPPHLIAGDFSTTSWETLYAEWRQEGCAIKLAGPVTPTFALGSSIDTLAFVLGSYIPSTFL